MAAMPSMIDLPFNLTSSELKVVKIAYRAGCFTPGSCSCRRPETPYMKEVAQKAGMSPENFSHLLSNARRKILKAASEWIFEGREYATGF